MIFVDGISTGQTYVLGSPQPAPSKLWSRSPLTAKATASYAKPPAQTNGNDMELRKVSPSSS